MRRPMLVLTTLAAVALTAPLASAAPARATGGGFTRDGQGRNATKTMLTLDASPATQRGSATYTVTKPGTSTTNVAITLTCVVVSGKTAYASGHDSANKPWYLKVVDNGEPGRNDQFGVSQQGDTLLGVLPVLSPLASNCSANNVATRVINGGNYQVVPA